MLLLERGRMRKLTNQEFINKLETIHGNDYVPLEDYKGSNTKIQVRHNECGSILNMSPNEMYRGRCKYCGIKRRNDGFRKSQEQFVSEVYELVGNEYTVIGEYRKNSTNISILHNTCGHQYEVRPKDFIRGDRCPMHRYRNSGINSVAKSHKEFLSDLPQWYEDEYEIKSEYVNALTDIIVQCRECGHNFRIKPPLMYRGNGCVKCVSSSGEKEVRAFLNDISLNFEEQVTFDGCTHEKPLRFDFAVYDPCGELQCLIEYNGEQHYKPVDFYGGEEMFELIKLRDSIKLNYCKENNITLIIIRFDESVEEVLDKLIPR